ncbi:MAG: hypothetical protein QOD99_1136 [Chthoniobacter sp.]|nr:hypothetical protein [Chthoniobacter sp.]
MKSSLRFLLAAAGTLLLPAAPAWAADIFKANNQTILTDSNSWVSTSGGVLPPPTAPGPGDVAVFDSTIQQSGTGTVTTLYGGDLSWGGIRVANPALSATSGALKAYVISGTGNTLTLGASGIDMSNATRTFLIGSSVLIAANQTWAVADASANITSPTTGSGSFESAFALSQLEDLIFSGTGSASNAALSSFNLGGFTVTTSGSGTIVIHSGYLVTNGTFNVGNGTAGTVITNGTNANRSSALTVQSGGSRNQTINSDVTFNVSSTLRMQANGGVFTSAAAVNILNGGILNLVSANSTAGNSVTLSGSLNISGTSILHVSNSPSNGAGSQPITITGNLAGAAPLTIQNNASNAASVFSFMGDNSGYNGAVTVSGTIGNRFVRLGSDTAGSANATWTVNSGNTLQVGGTAAATGASVQLGVLNGSGTIMNPVTSSTSSITVGSGIFGGVISSGSSTLNLTKATAGTLALSGSNTYTGATAINAGTLVVSGSISATGNVTVGDALNLATAAVLSGSGRVGNVTLGPAIAANSGAKVSPSLSVTTSGTTLNTSNFTMNSGAHLALQLGRTTPGTDFASGISDRVNATGGVTLNGGDLQLSLLSGYTPAVNDVLYLLINDLSDSIVGTPGTFVSVNGTPTVLTQDSTFTVGGNTYKISYTADTATSSFEGAGNDVALQLVPEPGAWGMLLGGAGVLFAARGLRRRAR